MTHKIKKQMTLMEFMATFTEAEEEACQLAMDEVRADGGTSGQGMAACAAVVRGSRSNNVERSLDIDKNTFNDKYRALNEVVSETYETDRNYTYVEDFDDDYVYFYVNGELFREGYEAADAVATLNGDRVDATRETTFVVADADERESRMEGRVERSVLQTLTKFFGGSDKKNLVNKNLKLKKQFDDDSKLTTEFLYVAPNEVDGVGDIYLEEDAQPMIDSFNKAIDEGRLQSGLFHKHLTEGFTVVKAYLAEEDCTMGEHDIVKGQPLVDIQYNSPVLYELRKAGDITGPSIGARAKEIIVLEDGVEKSIGEGTVSLAKGLSLDDLKSPAQPKRILKGINFDWANPELTLTDPSQGGACSLKNDIILEKSLKPNESQEAILKKIEEEFTPLAKALGADNTSVTNQNQKGNDNDMSVEMQKQLDEMAQKLAISEAERKLTKYNLTEEVQAELAKAIVVGGDVESVVKAMDAMEVLKEEAVTKAAEEAGKEVENPVAKALADEKGDSDTAEEGVEKSVLDKLREKRTAQAEAK